MKTLFILLIAFSFHIIYGQEISSQTQKESITFLPENFINTQEILQLNNIYQNNLLYSEYLKQKDLNYNLKNNYYFNYPFYNKQNIYNPSGVTKAEGFWVAGFIQLLSEKLFPTNSLL
ncbi:hypothetical protein [Apibacter adventoris]|uniref:hypothetical protein n=1 Tax=Apibacter adventoris TaxID=1679466 RepID=UPI000CF6A0C5|nr:hypothetical protein [Apibacter adventoris]PQL96051.1 hypothetical protein C4S76_00745 [Apibacter adventoris]